MTKAELIERVAALVANDPRKTNIGKAGIGIVFEALAAVAADEFSVGGEIPLPGLGKLVVRDRAARRGRNPRTGAPIEIPAGWAVVFRTGQALKDAVNA